MSWNPDRAGRQVESNAEVAQRLVDIAGCRAAQGRWDTAAGWARTAAAFSVTNPTGWLRSSALETTLDVLADVVPPAITASSRSGVLHVVSELHALGGHRSMLLRWLHADARLGVTADLAVTRSHPVPPAVIDAVLATGGCVTVLGRHRPMARAARLRALAARHRLVISHGHADDPIPAIAFGAAWSTASGVPVVMVDHADHLFWLPAGTFDALISLREPGERAAVELRGIAEDQIHRLPIPIELMHRRPQHHEGVTLIAVARPQKFHSSNGDVSFPDVVVPALTRVPQARLMVLGPPPADPAWAVARDRLGERLWLTGLQDDPAVWRARADIHLDPIPFGSATSLLESAAFGLPAVALRPDDLRQRLLSSSGVLSDGVAWVPDPDAYADELVRLVRDDDYRQALGDGARSTVERVNDMDQWVELLRTFYAHSHSLSSRHPQVSPPIRDQLYGAALLGVESSVPLQWILSGAASDFDASDRALMTARVTRARLMRRLHGHPAAQAGADADVLIPESDVH